MASMTNDYTKDRIHDVNRPSLCFSARLELALRTYLVHANQLWLDLVRLPTFKQIYPSFLIQTYHYIKYSCPLMRSALNTLAAPPAIGHSEVQAYLSRHISDEDGHDEWVLRDLLELGVGRLSATVALPLPSVISLVGSQMYMIEHVSPLAILGYMFVLEGFPQTGGLLQFVQQQHEIPSFAMTTLAHHSDIDQEHGHALRALLDGSEFTDDEEEVIMHSALLTSRSVGRFYEEVAILWEAQSLTNGALFAGTDSLMSAVVKS